MVHSGDDPGAEHDGCRQRQITAPVRRCNTIDELVEEYLAFCADRGEEPDQPFSGKLSIKLSPEQHRRIILAAENSGKDLNSWVAEVLAQAVN